MARYFKFGSNGTFVHMQAIKALTYWSYSSTQSEPLPRMRVSGQLTP